MLQLKDHILSEIESILMEDTEMNEFIPIKDQHRESIIHLFKYEQAGSDLQLRLKHTFAVIVSRNSCVISIAGNKEILSFRCTEIPISRIKKFLLSTFVKQGESLDEETKEL